MDPRLAIILLLLGGCPFSSTAPAEAEEKSLYWQNFFVTAHLNNDGRLQVKEHQTIVFNGDWNGGERVFNVKPGQSFTLNGLFRMTPGGQKVRLKQGNLAEVDRWNWHGKKTLRWRSRLASAPPFRNQPITYTIEYSLGNILIPSEDGNYTLNHDFAFPDRSGIIRNFSLDLSVDDGWDQAIFPFAIAQNNLAPGRGFVVKTTLSHLKGGPAFIYKKPPLIQRPVQGSIAPAPDWLVITAGVFLLVILLLCSISFFRHERRSGRFLAGPDPAAIDEFWLEQHIFNLLPESVGATWDKKTTGHEVAAVLARLVVEEKMSSRLEPVVIPILNWPVPGMSTLHLSLLKPRSEFSGYERKLIDGFFIDGDTTDTRRIRSFYRKEGRSFLPAEKIRDTLEKRVKDLTAALKEPFAYFAYGWLIPLAGFFVGFFIFLTNFFLHQEELFLTLGSGIAGIISLAVGAGNGYNYRCRSDRMIWRIMTLYFMPILMGAVFLTLYFFRASSLLNCGLFFLFGSALYTIFYTAKTRDSREGVQLCKTLNSGRRFFQQELQKEHPAIKDDWFPYLLAYGLGPDVDKWTQTFQGGGSLSRYTGGSATGFGDGFNGGGGRFGGAGASGSWGAAATSLGSSTSSSSGSGGSSGWSSSGGGGGGGW